MDIAFRQGRQSDHALVIDSFVKTYMLSPQAHGACGAVIASLIEPLLQASYWTLLIAHPEGDEDTVLGFILLGLGYKTPTVAWIQVRAPFRKHGIAKALLHHIWRGSLPREINTPFMVQKIGDAYSDPKLVELAKAHGVTIRTRPHIPNQVAYDNLLAYKED